MERPWSYEAAEGISSEIGGGDKKLFGGERKFCSGVNIVFSTTGYVHSTSPYRERNGGRRLLTRRSVARNDAMTPGSVHPHFPFHPPAFQPNRHPP